MYFVHYQFKDKDKKNIKFYEWWFDKIGITKYNRKSRYIYAVLFAVNSCNVRNIISRYIPYINTNNLKERVVC